jgi:hypothetical protein
MEKNVLNPSQRKRSAKTATPATTDLKQRKRAAITAPAAAAEPSRPKPSRKTAKAADLPAPGQAGTAVRRTTAAPSGDGVAAISPEERQEMIAIAAYYRAARHGFSGSTTEQDWLEAEAEVDQALSRQR